MQRLAILCSFNLDLIARPLAKAVAGVGLEAELYLSGYGQWAAEALDPGSALARFAPTAAVLFLDAEDVLPSLTEAGSLSPLGEARARGAAAFLGAEATIRALLGRTTGPVLCHLLVAPPRTAVGLLEGGGYSHTAAIDAFNAALRDFSATEPRLSLVPYDALVGEHGWARWHDRRMWHVGRMRLAAGSYPLLAALYARCLGALLTPRRKCLVLDLDNTLWGGVLGEDGLGGIQLGHSGVGLAFREFQMAILALSRRGILLAAASKNNLADAVEALRDHPDMVLRPEHFACLEINWSDKPESLRRVAQRLNIGLDSLVFWDDSPLERGMVGSQLPEVLVPEVPADPSDYAAFLLAMPCFDVLRLTAEDQARGQMYREQVARDAFLDAAAPTTLDSYFASLEMVVAFEAATPASIPRIAQLTQRTNQLNLTTRRYTEAEVAAWAGDPTSRVLGLSLRDRFGDLGLVGAAMMRERALDWELDTFLMSCRALGRRVEEAFAAHLASLAGETGKPLRGVFVPTRKNQPTREFLERHGLLAPGPAEAQPIEVTGVGTPPWLRVVVS